MCPAIVFDNLNVDRVGKVVLNPNSIAKVVEYHLNQREFLRISHGA